MLKHCRCITAVAAVTAVARTSNMYNILLIHVKGRTKSTNGALPQGSVELNARQDEKVKTSRKGRKTVDRGVCRVVCVQRYNKYAECDGNDRH